MKMIIAVLHSEQLSAVKQALFDGGIHHFSAMPVMGTAPAAEQRMYRGVERKVTLFNRVRLEIIVKDPDVEKAVKAVTDGAKDSGGYGRIFLLPVEDAITIWTGDHGDKAF